MTVTEPCILFPLLSQFSKYLSEYKLHEAAKPVFTTAKMILGAEAAQSRVAIIGGFAVLNWTD